MRKNSLGMADIQFRKENEVKTQYSIRITQEEWNSHEAYIRQLHGERKTKVEILESLRARLFCPSMPQLCKQMRKWGLKVYSQRKDTSANLQKRGESAPASDAVTPIWPSSILSMGTSRAERETGTIKHVQDSSLTVDENICPVSDADHHCKAETQLKGGVDELVATDNISMLDAGSETSSMRTFHALAIRLKETFNPSSHSVSSVPDTMSICSGDSWSFRQVTGLPVHSSVERLRTPKSGSDMHPPTSFALDSEEDLFKLQMSPLLPLQRPSQTSSATSSNCRRAKIERKKINAGTSLPPVACWWPLSPPKYEDEIRFPAAYKLLHIFKSSLSIITAFEGSKSSVLGPSQVFHSFHDSLLHGIGCLNEALATLLAASDEWSEDSKLRGDLRLITIFAKLTLVAELTEAWQSPPETSIDITDHLTAAERTRGEVLRALQEFHCRMQRDRRGADVDGTQLDIHTCAQSVV